MFKFRLVTPEKAIETDVEVEEVLLPAHRGQLHILPGHAPLVTTLGVGIMEYRLKGTAERKRAVISWGYCEVSPVGVSVLAETAETKEEIDKDRASQSLKSAEAQLASGDLAPDEISRFQSKVRRAQARLELVGGK